MQYKLAGIFIFNWSNCARRRSSYPSHISDSVYPPRCTVSPPLWWLKRLLLPSVRCSGVANKKIAIYLSSLSHFTCTKPAKHNCDGLCRATLGMCALCYAMALRPQLAGAARGCRTDFRRSNSTLHFILRVASPLLPQAFIGVAKRMQAYLPATSMQTLTSASWRNFFNLVSSAPLMDFELVCRGSGASS